MSLERLRSDLNPLREEDRPRGWWDVLLWVPIGFAVTRLVGDLLPWWAMGVLTLLVAAAHYFGPAVVEVVAGAGGLIASGAAAWDGAGCQDVIGEVGIIVVIVFGSMFVVSSFVRLIGAASLREMGKHLLIATASIEIALFVTGPTGEPLIDPEELYAPGLLLAVLMAVSQIGLIDRMEIGMLALGAMLVPIEVVLAVHDNPCGAGGFAPLVGTAVFAGAAYSFATARPLRVEGEDDEDDADDRKSRRHWGYENQVGVWVDATPDTPVWADPDPESGVWVDSTPETGTWLDDDYEDEFRDPDAGPGRDR